MHVRTRTLALLAGGRTPEHDLSLDSAHALAYALAGTPWRASIIAVHPTGEFPVPDPVARLREFDYVLPLLHGVQAEGIRGLLDAFDVPVLGEGPAAATVALDKPLAKRLLRDAGLPVLPHVVILRRHLATSPREACAAVAEAIRFPCVVKPACGVASVGAGVVWEPGDLPAALYRAAAWDTRVLVEPFLDARELEVAVIAGSASLPGELVYRAEIHDHSTKLAQRAASGTRAEGGLELVIPAMVDESERERLRAMAVSACAALGIEMVGRVELLRDRNTRELIVNEVNALPAFQAGAVFWRLWEASGASAAQLVDRLAAACDARARERFRTLATLPPPPESQAV